MSAEHDPILEEGIPDVYFENNRTRYWLKDGTGRFRPFTQTHAKCLLKKAGLKKTDEADEIAPVLEDALIERGFDFPLAVPGYPIGVHDMNGRLMFVPHELRLIEPAKGEWPMLQSVWEKSMGKEQFRWFYWWLASTLQGLYINEWVPAPVVALIGETGAFKSLTQAILTELLGSREARVIQAMSGTTAFNGDWAEAVHLVVEDDFGDRSKNTRQKVKETVKSVAVNTTHRIHPKGAQAFSLKPFWRMTVSCNPVEESLSVLPDVDDTVRHKLSLLWLRRCAIGMDTDSPTARKAFWETLMGELPAMIHEMLHAGSVPDDLRDHENRCAVCAHHHPMAMEAVQSLSDDGQMLQVISENVDMPWSGTASTLLEELQRGNAEGRHTARSLGRLLVRLCSSHASRVKRMGEDGHAKVGVYRITESGEMDL